MNKEHPSSEERSFSGGEGGSSASIYPEEPILLPSGTPVKEALLIIRFRLDAKGDLDSM